MVNSKWMRRNIKRPKCITIIALIMLIFTTINLIRVIQVMAQWQFLSTVLSHAPVYQLITGMVWFLGGLTLLVNIWYGKRNTPFFIMVGVVLYSIYYWIDRFAISSTPFDSNWLFMLIINGVLLIYIVWSLTRNNTKTYFGEAYDTGSQDR